MTSAPPPSGSTEWGPTTLGVTLTPAPDPCRAGHSDNAVTPATHTTANAAGSDEVAGSSKVESTQTHDAQQPGALVRDAEVADAAPLVEVPASEAVDAETPVALEPEVPEADDADGPDGEPDCEPALVRIAVSDSVKAAATDVVSAAADADWHREQGGRWVVGDAGRQPEIPANPSRMAQTRADLSVDWGELGAVEFRSASIRGFGHFEDGKPRQDSCGVAVEPNGRWLVGCVADGVSSARFAHEAADIAVNRMTRLLGDELRAVDAIPDAEAWLRVAPTLGWQSATDVVSEEIRSRAEEHFREGYERAGDEESIVRLAEHGLPNRDARQRYATTAVVFAVATAPLLDGGVPFAVAVAAGDSSAMILSEGAWHPITAVKNAGAEVASSVVSPLPKTAVVAPIVGVLESGQALVVFTDGIGDPLGGGQGVVGRFLASRWQTPPDPIEFARDIGFYRKTFVDDRTAVAVWARTSM